MNEARFKSHGFKNINISVKVNHTDSIFHIYEDNGIIIKQQIYFDIEDAKKIKKILSDLISKKEKGEI